MGCKAMLMVLGAGSLLALGCSSAADDPETPMMPPNMMMPIGTAGSAPIGPTMPGGAMNPSSNPGMTGNTTPPAVMPMAGNGDVNPPMTTGGTGGSMAEPMAGSMAEPMAGSMAEPMGAEHKTPCITQGSQVAILGDSYVQYMNSLTPLLEAKANAEGQLKQGDHYNLQAVPGSSLAVGLILIPPQWDIAKRQSNNDIKYVVMDGGGNDVLLYNMQCLADGASKDPACQKVADDATAVAREMMNDMKATGVSDVLYFFYPHVPAGGQDIMDNYAAPKAKENCEGNNATDPDFHCHFVSLVDAFEGHPEYILGDGIHPTAAGAAVQTDVIWKAMKDNCIGQASGCCSM